MRYSLLPASTYLDATTTTTTATCSTVGMKGDQVPTHKKCQKKIDSSSAVPSYLGTSFMLILAAAERETRNMISLVNSNGCKEP